MFCGVFYTMLIFLSLNKAYCWWIFIAGQDPRIHFTSTQEAGRQQTKRLSTPLCPAEVDHRFHKLLRTVVFI